MIVTSLREAAAARREMYAAQASLTDMATRSQVMRSSSPVGLPSERYGPDRVAGLRDRSGLVERDGKSFYRLEGYATTFDQPYEMYDMFGPYLEVVAQGAADETLAAGPDTIFVVNHGVGGGPSLARTKAVSGVPSLDLSADGTGLKDVAWLNPKRDDVQTLMLSIDDGIVTEQSFKFFIPDGAGVWSEDFETFEIRSFDLQRGDVSAVNYGANPTTTIAARQQQMFADLDRMPVQAARAALLRLGERADLKHANSRVPGQWVARVRSALQQQRALGPEDASFLSQVLGWLTSIDNIVDDGQETIADYLGVPNPDDEAGDMTMDGAMDGAEMQNSATGRGARTGGRSITHIEALLDEGRS